VTISIPSIMVALLWGIVCGYGGLRLIEALLNIISGLHLLFNRRWKSLVNRSAPGQIDYPVLLDLLARMLMQAFLTGLILVWGDEWVRHWTPFRYDGITLPIWGALTALAAAATLRSSLRKIVISWKIGHEYGYAQKRKRTLLIRR